MIFFTFLILVTSFVIRGYTNTVRNSQRLIGQFIFNFLVAYMHYMIIFQCLWVTLSFSGRINRAYRNVPTSFQSSHTQSPQTKTGLVVCNTSRIPYIVTPHYSRGSYFQSAHSPSLYKERLYPYPIFHRVSPIMSLKHSWDSRIKCAADFGRSFRILLALYSVILPSLSTFASFISVFKTRLN